MILNQLERKFHLNDKHTQLYKSLNFFLKKIHNTRHLDILAYLVERHGQQISSSSNSKMFS